MKLKIDFMQNFWLWIQIFGLSAGKLVWPQVLSQMSVYFAYSLNEMRIFLIVEWIKHFIVILQPYSMKWQSVQFFHQMYSQINSRISRAHIYSYLTFIIKLRVSLFWNNSNILLRQNFFSLIKIRIKSTQLFMLWWEFWLQ